MHRPLVILALLLTAWFLQNCGKADPDPREGFQDRLRAIWLADVAARHRGNHGDGRPRTVAYVQACREAIEVI